jgi:hypothetical protein
MQQTGFLPHFHSAQSEKSSGWIDFTLVGLTARVTEEISAC